jgi:hypothetical protein
MSIIIEEKKVIEEEKKVIEEEKKVIEGNIECEKDKKDLELYKNENAKIREEVTRCGESKNLLEETKIKLNDLQNSSSLKRKITSFLFLLISLLYLYKIGIDDEKNINKYRGYVGISLLMFIAVIILDIIHASSNNNLKISVNNISETINNVGIYIACVIIIYTNYSNFRNIPSDFINLIKSGKDNLSKYSLIIIIGFVLLATVLSYFKNFFSFLQKK